MEADRRGRVILLNGASSSGKSSVGRALVDLLPDPWFLLPVDALGALRSEAHTGQDDEAVQRMLRRTRLGYHRVVAALASVGNDVVMDYPLSETWRVADLLEVLAAYDVTLVEVRCDPDELDRRERARGDRPAGLARSQSAVYALGEHDVAVDTTSAGAEVCARSIADALDGLSAPKAFERLRTRRL